jgi:asparaginyl-tRNA synthetase
MDTPILTPSACEGTSTLFETPYFERQAYLTQSGQLYNEATAAALGRVYCFGPTFRAEKSKTRRHLTEFWMIDPEAAFLDLDGCMALAEGMVVFVVERVLERRRQELATLERDLAVLERVRPPFPRLTYDEAISRLRDQGHPVPWGEDFGGDEETIVSNLFDRPVFVHRYPAQCKAFYMQPDPARPEVVLGADLLASDGYGEIIGGGSASTIRICWNAGCVKPAFPGTSTHGTSICAGTVRSLTADSASGSSGRSRGSAGWSTCGRRSRFHG